MRVPRVPDDRVPNVAVGVVELGYVRIILDLDGASDVFESELGERGKGCAGGDHRILPNMHVTSYEREMFEACQRRHAQVLDNE